MSFLVVFNGQFTPLVQRISVHTSREVHPVRSTPESSGVPEFREILEEKIEEPIGRATRAINAYQKEKKRFEEQRSRLYARDLMSSPVTVISEKARANEARAILQKYGFRHLPVVNSFNIIIGMISDREVQGGIDNKICADIMINGVIIAEENTSVHELAVILLDKKINALPIINDRREVIGIITFSDILRYVISSTPFLGKA